MKILNKYKKNNKPSEKRNKSIMIDLDIRDPKSTSITGGYNKESKDGFDWSIIIRCLCDLSKE